MTTINYSIQMTLDCRLVHHTRTAQANATIKGSFTDGTGFYYVFLLNVDFTWLANASVREAGINYTSAENHPINWSILGDRRSSYGSICILYVFFMYESSASRFRPYEPRHTLWSTPPDRRASGQHRRVHRVEFLGVIWQMFILRIIHCEYKSLMGYFL